MDSFNPSSLRAKKALAGKVLNHPLARFLLILLTLSGLAGFAYLLFFIKNPLGWLALAVALLAFMILLWAQSDLDRIPLGKTEDINDILSADVILLLRKSSAPADFIHSFVKTKSGAFLAARFGLTPAVLEPLAPSLPDDFSSVFPRARELRKQTDTEVVSGGILLVALLESLPDVETFLRRLKLEKEDLYEGIVWFNHLYGLVRSAKKKRRDGGIARDFSFGYIPTLSKFGQNLSLEHLRGEKMQIRQSAHQEIVAKILDAFSRGGRQNIALIGPEGSGRTTIIRAFAEELLDADAKIPASLKYRQVFALDAASLLSAASGRGEIEGLLTIILNEAYAAKNIIVCLENAHVFFEDGIGSVDLSNLLLPIIEAGRLRMILTMNEQKFLELSARSSSLANKLNQVVVDPANELETLKIMEDNVPFLEGKHGVVFSFLALKEAYRLSARYIQDLVMPGRALSLLESSASYAENGKLVTPDSVKVAIEKTKGVRLSSASDDLNKSKLLNLEELIHERMIDQVEAVRTVSDALRRAAAGVRNENKPIGTFLFLGPTGVGKTELAKALAEVYFRGENNLIRLDLNEFVSESDVSRLIEAGKDNADSLTARVMKSPFSVILLDEIEKAHPAVLTTLLQLLDEGVLRDASNREVSFRDAIVIATSNAGAEAIRSAVESGANLADLKEKLINEMISSGEFKPEFLNRFDEICLFSPLGKPELRQIVDLIIKSVNQTLAPQKISVELTNGAKDLLVERGYDPKMGARPMRRTVQKSVENLVAKAVLEGSASSGSIIQIDESML